MEHEKYQAKALKQMLKPIEARAKTTDLILGKVQDEILEENDDPKEDEAEEDQKNMEDQAKESKSDNAKDDDKDKDDKDDKDDKKSD